MKFYFLVRIEYSGYECAGHRVHYLVAANSLEEARKLRPRHEDIDGYVDYEESETEFEIPDISKKKKSFIVI